MATPAQTDANRKNATKSTGPRTPEGKAVSRANATKHGLAGEGVVLPSSETEGRRETWARDYRIEDEAAAFALDRLVAASIQIERAEEAMEGIYASEPERARLAWDAIKEAEAAEVFARIGKSPGAVVARLKGSLHGVGQLEAAWGRLGESLEDGGEWAEAEEAMALDLLGVPAACRAGRTAIDGANGSDRGEHRRALVRQELAELEAVVEDVGELDLLDRRLAMAGLSTLNSAPARPVIRYEREAWRRFREAKKALEPYKIPAEDRPASPAARVEPTPAPPPLPRAGTKPIAGPKPGPSWAVPSRDIESDAYAYADFRVGIERPRR